MMTTTLQRIEESAAANPEADKGENQPHIVVW